MSLVFRRYSRAISVVFTRTRHQSSSFLNLARLVFKRTTPLPRLGTAPFHRYMATAKEPKISNLTISEVLEAGKKGTPVIDVREQVEIHNTGLIPGSINIPLGHLDEALNLSADEFKERYTIPKPEKGDKIIMSCQSGNRSKRAITALQEKGFTNLYNNAEGWKGYEEFCKKK